MGGTSVGEEFEWRCLMAHVKEATVDLLQGAVGHSILKIDAMSVVKGGIMLVTVAAIAEEEGDVEDVAGHIPVQDPAPGQGIDVRVLVVHLVLIHEDVLSLVLLRIPVNQDPNLHLVLVAELVNQAIGMVMLER